ncbi:MAG: NINE protein [Alphaproteobacteria bacterium]
MDELNQAAYIGEFKKKKKSTLVGYLLLGGGVHYMYLGKFWLFLLFIFTGGGCLVWFLIDLFRIPSMVRTYNKTIALDVLRDIQILQ